jgi:hypothetical protein
MLRKSVVVRNCVMPTFLGGAETLKRNLSQYILFLGGDWNL